MSLGVFGKYELLDRLAVGGMAEIFLARSTSLGGVTRTCVIKRILPQHCANRHFVSMFIDEARIMIGLDHPNVVKLLDFGLAQLGRPGAVPEIPDKIYGTPEYMAPEMARPQVPTEAPADVYALGVLIYQMITGELPFQSDDPKKIIEGHLHIVPDPPSIRAPDAVIDPALQRTVLKALRKRPERRFPSMEEFSRALWRILIRLRQN